MLLSIKKLTFGWQQETLFNNISCELQQPEIIQLIGENGIGKTTLLQLIAGMIPHFNHAELLQGDIILNNQSVLQNPPKHFFPKISFVPSINIDFFLLTEMLSQEILLTNSILKIELTQQQKKFNEFAEFFPTLKNIIDEPFKNLQFEQKVLALSYIYYLQGGSLFLFDEVMNSFSESDILQWYSLFDWLNSKKCSIIFIDHHQIEKKYSTWMIKNKDLIVL